MTQSRHSVWLSSRVFSDLGPALWRGSGQRLTSATQVECVERLGSSHGKFLRQSHREDGNHDKVIAVLRQNKFTAYVSPVKTGSVVAEKKADTQATVPIVNLAKLLSVELQAPMLAVSVHDDDYLLLGAYVSGQEVTDYSSDRDHRVADKSSPAGKAEKLCAVFDATHAVETVAAILSSTTYGLAHEHHQALVDALGLSDFAVAQGFRYLEEQSDVEGPSAEASEWRKLT